MKKITCRGLMTRNLWGGYAVIVYPPELFMAQVKILVKGYAKREKGVELAQPNTVLIFDGNIKVLVDPGSNAKLLLKALKKEKLKPWDIDIIFLTHYNLDHLLNIRLFPEHDIYDGDTINRADKIISYSASKIPKTNIQIIKTPGHAHEHCSLIAQTARGKVAIAGDVWWWASNEKQKLNKASLLKKKDLYAKNQKALLASRKALLAAADCIIPGHGKTFRVEK